MEESALLTHEEARSKITAEFALDVLSTPNISIRIQELANNILEKYLNRTYTSMLELK
jgi:hypothetical protein